MSWTNILLTLVGAYVVWAAYALGVSVGKSGCTDRDIWGRPTEDVEIK